MKDYLCIYISLCVHIDAHSTFLHGILGLLEILCHEFSWLPFKQGIDISPILWMGNRGPVTPGMNITTDGLLLLCKPQSPLSCTGVFPSQPQMEEFTMAPFNLYFTLGAKLPSLFGLGWFTLGSGGWKETKQGS